MTGLQNIPKNIGTDGEGRSFKKQKEKRKRLPSKDTSQHRVHLNNLVLPENYSIRIFRSSPSLFFPTRTELISEITNNRLSRTLGAFQASGGDHLCLGVFFFRFRLKKQQHLSTERETANRDEDERGSSLEFVNIMRASIEPSHMLNSVKVEVDELPSTRC